MFTETVVTVLGRPQNGSVHALLHLAIDFWHVQDKGYRNSTSRQVILEMLKQRRVLGGGVLAQKPWPAFAHYFSHCFPRFVRIIASKVGVHTAETWSPRTRRNSTKGNWRSLILSSRDWMSLGRTSFWK